MTTALTLEHQILELNQLKSNLNLQIREKEEHYKNGAVNMMQLLELFERKAALIEKIYQTQMQYIQKRSEYSFSTRGLNEY
jgi:hypothetical protein